MTHAVNGGSVLALYVPRHAGGESRVNEPFARRLVRADNAPLRLLASYARAALDEPAVFGPGVETMVASHVCDLVRAVWDGGGIENPDPF